MGATGAEPPQEVRVAAAALRAAMGPLSEHGSSDDEQPEVDGSGTFVTAVSADGEGAATHAALEEEAKEELRALLKGEPAPAPRRDAGDASAERVTNAIDEPKREDAETEGGGETRRGAATKETSLKKDARASARKRSRTPGAPARGSLAAEGL